MSIIDLRRPALKSRNGAIQSEPRLRQPSWLSRSVPLSRIGSEGEGWMVPLGHLNADSAVYSTGDGADTSFELGLVDTTGCVIVMWSQADSQTPKPASNLVYLGRKQFAKGLADVMREFNHERIDLFRLRPRDEKDPVLQSVLGGQIRVGVACLDFSLMPADAIREVTHQLNALGFQLLHAEGSHRCTFLERG